MDAVTRRGTIAADQPRPTDSRAQRVVVQPQRDGSAEPGASAAATAVPAAG
jgi:hypothetical protein